MTWGDVWCVLVGTNAYSLGPEEERHLAWACIVLGFVAGLCAGVLL